MAHNPLSDDGLAATPAACVETPDVTPPTVAVAILKGADGSATCDRSGTRLPRTASLVSTDD